MDTNKIYSEVHATLLSFGDDFYNRIPAEVTKAIADERDPSYRPIVDPSKALHEQNLRPETLAMVASINLNYWCHSDEEREALLSILTPEERAFAEKLKSANGMHELLQKLKDK